MGNHYKYEARALANKVLVSIMLDPARHDQRNWGLREVPADYRSLEDCKTTACVAGYSVLFSDLARWDSHGLFESDGSKLLLKVDENKALEYFGEVDEVLDFEYIASELLDLSESDAYILFYDTSNEQARRALAYIAADKEIDWISIGLPESFVKARRDEKRVRL